MAASRLRTPARRGFMLVAPLREPRQHEANLMADKRKAPFVGRSLPRREDRRLLTGRGLYVADLALPHMLHAAFVRAPVAHARIRSVDLSGAKAAPLRSTERMRACATGARTNAACSMCGSARSAT